MIGFCDLSKHKEKDGGDTFVDLPDFRPTNTNHILFLV